MGEKYSLDRNRRGLTAREREVLRQVKTTKRNQSEIAEALGMTRQRVSQVLSQLRMKGALPHGREDRKDSPEGT